MTTTPPTTPKPRRRWLQFSLRTLLVLMLVLGCGFGWLGREVQRARTQQRTAAAISKVGGQVSYRDVSNSRVRTAVTWLAKLLGQELPPDIIGAQFDYTEVSDADLAQFQGLTQVEFLYLGCPQITDDGVANLKPLTNLQDLILQWSQVSDAGLENLRGLSRLQYLALGNTHVSDTGLVNIQGLTELQELDVKCTQVTGTGLAHLRGLTQLRWLYLANTQVNDAGLEHLRGLTQLRQLFLGSTQVTNAGIADLQKALPNCKIDR
ncbi:MAG: hypothetical protein NTY19_07585 [Planctomycetota bacterium]|nr:hypothetical protein [Planctomycetota bacterium]